MGVLKDFVKAVVFILLSQVFQMLHREVLIGSHLVCLCYYLFLQEALNVLNVFIFCENLRCFYCLISTSEIVEEGVDKSAFVSEMRHEDVKEELTYFQQAAVY